MDDFDDKVEVEKAQKASRKNLKDTYGKLIGDDWELAAINFVRKKEEVTTRQMKRLKEFSEAAAITAKELEDTHKEEGVTLARELKFWQSMQRRGNDATKSTADDEVKKINLLIATNDLDLDKATVEVEISEANKIDALGRYKDRLKKHKTLFAKLAAREKALDERDILLAGAKSNAEMAKQYNGELSSRERKSELSDLDKRIAALQDKRSGLSKNIATLTKVMEGLDSDRESAKIELDVAKKRFEGAELEADSIGNAARNLATLANKIKEISKKLGLKQNELAKKKRSHKNTIDLVTVLQETRHTIATFKPPSGDEPVPPDEALEQLRVAFKPYYTDPKGLPKGYKDGVYLVMEVPKDEAEAKIAFAEQKAIVEKRVNDFNFYREERDKKLEGEGGNYTAAMDEVWGNIKEGEHKADLDENGQFHYKDPVPRKTGDVVKLYVFCIGRKDDKLRFYVDEVTFDKSPKEPHAILLSSAK